MLTVDRINLVPFVPTCTNPSIGGTRSHIRVKRAADCRPSSTRDTKNFAARPALTAPCLGRCIDRCCSPQRAQHRTIIHQPAVASDQRVRQRRSYRDTNRDVIHRTRGCARSIRVTGRGLVRGRHVNLRAVDKDRWSNCFASIDAAVSCAAEISLNSKSLNGRRRPLWDNYTQTSQPLRRQQYWQAQSRQIALKTHTYSLSKPFSCVVRRQVSPLIADTWYPIRLHMHE